MKGTKKSFVMTGFMLVFAVAALLFVVLQRNNITGGDKTTTQAPPAIAADTEAYLGRVKAEGEAVSQLLRTDIKDVFYTLENSGKVRFYQYANGALSEVQASGSYQVNVTCSKQNIPATVYYYKKDGVISGYGLYTPEISDADVKYYNYAFFKLMNLPSSFSRSGSYLLLVDTDSRNALRNDKIFDEAFIYNTGNGGTTRLLYETNRSFGINGTYREDYHMLTSETVKDARNYMFFFSARFWPQDGGRMDIYRSGSGSSPASDNTRRALDVVDFYCKTNENGDGFYFLKNTENGFNLMLNTRTKSENDKVIKSFSGSYQDDYVRSGKYLLEKATQKLINLETREEKTLVFEGSADFRADGFSVNEKGGKVLLRGKAYGLSAVALATTDGSAGTLFFNERFAGLAEPSPLSDGSFLVGIASGTENVSYKYVVFA